VLLLLGLTSAPVLGAYCEAACADDTRPMATVPSCHEASPDGAGPAARTMEDCGDHTVVPAVLSELRSSRWQLSLWTTVLPANIGLSYLHGLGRGVTPPDPYGPPPPPIPPGATTLRI
jgi:hypothetical protein